MLTSAAWGTHLYHGQLCHDIMGILFLFTYCRAFDSSTVQGAAGTTGRRTIGLACSKTAVVWVAIPPTEVVCLEESTISGWWVVCGAARISFSSFSSRSCTPFRYLPILALRSASVRSRVPLTGCDGPACGAGCCWGADGVSLGC